MAQTDALDNTKWKLDPAKGKATLQFQNGRWAAKGCNNMSGPYRIEGSRIAGGQGMSTMMGCPPALEELDRVLMNLMSKNESFVIEGDVLILKASGGEWRFSKEPMPSKEAVTKFIYVASETKDCTGVGPMTCLQIREDKDGPWRLFYGNIIGFEREPGIEYRLRIKEDKVTNPAADQASVIWYLDMVVEQRAVSNN
jgi:heat shock protein HslJ